MHWNMVRACFASSKRPPSAERLVEWSTHDQQLNEATSGNGSCCDWLSGNVHEDQDWLPPGGQHLGEGHSLSASFARSGATPVVANNKPGAQTAGQASSGRALLNHRTTGQEQRAGAMQQHTQCTGSKPVLELASEVALVSNNALEGQHNRKVAVGPAARAVGSAAGSCASQSSGKQQGQNTFAPRARAGLPRYDAHDAAAGPMHTSETAQQQPAASTATAAPALSAACAAGARASADQQGRLPSMHCRQSAPERLAQAAQATADQQLPPVHAAHASKPAAPEHRLTHDSHDDLCPAMCTRRKGKSEACAEHTADVGTKRKRFPSRRLAQDGDFTS